MNVPQLFRWLMLCLLLGAGLQGCRTKPKPPAAQLPSPAIAENASAAAADPSRTRPAGTRKPQSSTTTPKPAPTLVTAPEPARAKPAAAPAVVSAPPAPAQKPNALTEPAPPAPKSPSSPTPPPTTAAAPDPNPRPPLPSAVAAPTLPPVIETPKPAPSIAKTSIPSSPPPLAPRATAAPADRGSSLGADLGGPGKPTATAPAAPLPIRSPAPLLGLALPNASPSLSLPSAPAIESRGSGSLQSPSLGTGNAAPIQPPATSPQPVLIPRGTTNSPPLGTNTLLKPIPVAPLLQEGKGGPTWREQQLSKQAAEQKAREEEQQRLGSALRRFLFRDDKR